MCGREQLEPAEPTWKASAMLMADEGDGKHGTVSFRQVSPFNPILVNINATGLPKGKHSVHIHAFGDIREGCKSTGPHVRHILVKKKHKINEMRFLTLLISMLIHVFTAQQIGNIDVPESGNIDISFYSSYVTLFGHRGIVGRSIVVHEKPIEFNRTPDLYGVPVVSPPVNPVSYQTEEMAVGSSLACGIITITENRQ